MSPARTARRRGCRDRSGCRSSTGFLAPSGRAARRRLLLPPIAAVETLAQGLHEVNDFRTLSLPFGRRDLLALALALDHVEHAFAVRVLVALGLPLDGERLDELQRDVELALVRAALRREVGDRFCGVAHLVVEVQGLEHEHVAARAHRGEVLLAAHHEPRDADAIAA